MVSQAELISKGITLWFLVLSQFFRDGIGPFNADQEKEITSEIIVFVKHNFSSLINLFQNAHSTNLSSSFELSNDSFIYKSFNHW